MRYRSLTVGTAEVLVPVVAAVLLGLGLVAWLTPGFGFAGSSSPDVMRIYSSLPMNDYASIVHGAQMALDEVDNKAGDFTLDLVPLDDARLTCDEQGENCNWKWAPDIELANARQAAADPDAMVYIGTYNSGAAKISIPVLNRVHMAMISPGNTYPGLTKPGTGTAGEPWTYYPLGVRNYFRVVPADDLQGAAAAAFAAERRFNSVYVLDDTELYGHGVAVIFAQAAQGLGLRVAGGPESIDVRANNYTELAQKIIGTNADLVYFGGITANHPGLVLRDLLRAGYTGAFMGADGLADTDFIKDAQQAGMPIENAYSTLVGLPAAKLTGAGADWYSRYKQRWPSDKNEDFAPFGYEAARVAISAIERANKKDREAIRAAVAATNSSMLAGQPILDEWRFDANGDTSLVTISVQEVRGAQWTYLGIMSYDAQTKRWRFAQQ
jgi:branched-chain amino acid transport system substrate-binding protein